MNKYLEAGGWQLVPGICFHVTAAMHLRPGTWYEARNAWYIHGTSYLVPGKWTITIFQQLGAKHLVLRIS